MKISRREKFVSLAEKRTTNAIRQIKLIGNLSNRGNYEYADTDISKIVKALNSEIKSMRNRFSSGGKDVESVFRF